MKMKSWMNVLCLTLLCICAMPGFAFAQTEEGPTTTWIGDLHWDECPAGFEEACEALHIAEHSPGRCTNGDGSLNINCYDWGSNSPRNATTEADGRSTATVYCPKLNGIYNPTGEWYTFSCTGYATGGGNPEGSSGHLWTNNLGTARGVSCETGSSTTTCGCYVFNDKPALVEKRNTSEFLGSSTQVGPKEFVCN